MHQEADNVKERYKRRQLEKSASLYDVQRPYVRHATKEREDAYEQGLRAHFDSLENLKVIEIGAGAGGNISFFKRLGIQPENIYANELIPERAQALRAAHPDINIIEGDATVLDSSMMQQFDIVFQSTVFTSILDDVFKSKLASVMTQLMKPSGIMLWYDFIYNNPSNKDVKGVGMEEVLQLFPELSLCFSKITLAPPIGRRVGNLYRFFNLLPILRTHVVGFGKKA
jgi:2-polyprenyl-3-methyl-5-hydroxy-6-metoxy-1,4-benzoquinol methylase